MMIHRLGRLLAVSFIVFGASVAHAQIPTTDIASLIQRVIMIASEFAQESELVEQTVNTYNTVEQTTNTAKSLQNQLGSALNTNQSSDLQSIQNAARAANAAGGLVNSNSAGGVMQELQTLYKPDSATGRPNYDTYMEGTKQTIRGAISNNGAILDGMSTEASRINSLVSQSNGASGALEAQQAGNQINAELASQIQKQRQQQAMQAQADSAAALAAAEERQQQANDSRAASKMFMFSR